MNNRTNTLKQIDWFCIIIYLLLASIGWLSIFSSSYDAANESLFTPGSRQLKQLIWIGISLVIVFLIFLIDSKFFSVFAYILYGVAMLSLIAVLILGKETNGARSWFEIGSFKFQPSELAKIFTPLALAQIITGFNFDLKKFKHLLLAFAIILLPTGMIILQNDTGSALVFLSLILVLYREGMKANYLFIGLAAIVMFILSILLSPGWVLIIATALILILYWLNERDNKGFLFALSVIGFLLIAYYFLTSNKLMEISFTLAVIIAVGITALMLLPKMIKAKRKTALILTGILAISFIYVSSLDFVFNQILKQHQRDRIEITLGLKEDLLGTEYNVNQSKIAIGSGGFSGKGFLQGTQTKFDFVPAQSTDFIFCTVGEEAGFLGTALVVILFTSLIMRLIVLAERQRSRFSRVYGYSVASILFFHVTINIGMTIGLLPVIGIPLPFFSYGGSSFMAFSVLLFIFLRLDASRLEIFR